MQLFIQRYHVMKFYLVKVTNWMSKRDFSCRHSEDGLLWSTAREAGKQVIVSCQKYTGVYFVSKKYFGKKLADTIKVAAIIHW